MSGSARRQNGTEEIARVALFTDIAIGDAP